MKLLIVPYPTDISRLIAAGTTNNIEIAALTYVSRRDRDSNPDGSFDNAKRWYPDDDEEQSCCASIRRPTRAYPFSLMVHCRTLGHICTILQVNESAVRKILGKIDPKRQRAAAEREKKRQELIELIRRLLMNLRDDSIVDLLMAAVMPVKSIPVLTEWSVTALPTLYETLLGRLPDKAEANRAAKTRAQVYLPLYRDYIAMEAA